MKKHRRRTDARPQLVMRADWFDRRGEPRCSLEDRGCQGMVLTAISSAWPQDGRHTSWVSWGNAHRTQATLSRRDADRDQAKTHKDKSGRRPLSLQPEKKKPPVGCSSPGRRQSRSQHQQSHPTRVVAGVDILRHTSAHKGSPLFRRRAPAPNTVDPRGLLTACHGTGRPGVRRPLVIDGSISINGIAADAIRKGTTFSSLGLVAGS